MSLQGVLLYEGGPHLGRSQVPPALATATGTNPSSSGRSGGNSRRPRNVPPETFNLRTNFTTAADQDDDHLGYDEYKQSPSPILEDQTAKHAAAGLDFGPSPPAMQTAYVFVGAVVGAGVGVLFCKLHVGAEWLKVVALPGDLYIRALRCLIVPMVLCVMTIVVAENVSLGRTSIFRWRTLVPFLASSTTAAAQGTALAFAFQNMFTPTEAEVKDMSIPANAVTKTFNLTMQCANGLFVAATAAGGIACSPNATSSATFVAHTTTAASGMGADLQHLSVVDQVTGILHLMVPANIFASLVDGSLVSIVFFSFPLGYVVAQSGDAHGPNLVLQLLRQVRNLCLLLLYGMLKFTPVAVGFLVGAAVSQFDDGTLGAVMGHVAYFMLAFLIGVFTHNVVVLPLLVLVWTKSNPFRFMQHLFPAYVFAFGCASSMATLPVAVACMQRGSVSRALALISMPFGTPVNMNGCALYYPLEVVFMACMAGFQDELTFSKWALIFFVGWLGSMGTAPVPNAGMVYSLTLWTACFPSQPVPASFAFVYAADFVVDRVATMVNVNGNAMVTRILADQVDETFELEAAAQHV